MPVVVIDDKEYEIEKMSDENKELVSILGTGTDSIRQKEHELRSLKSTQEFLFTRLKENLLAEEKTEEKGETTDEQLSTD
jgi:hypothetical protein